MSQTQEAKTPSDFSGSYIKIVKPLDNVLTMEMSVLSTFFQKNPDMTVEKVASTEMELKDILKPPYEMGKSLHNPKEPALRLLQGDKEVHKEYWINGKRLTEEEAVKLEHDTTFGKKVQDLINND